MLINIEEMAKASAQLSRKHRIQSNLEITQRNIELSLAQEARCIAQKLANAEENRLKEITKKATLRHAKELQWNERREKAERLHVRK